MTMSGWKPTISVIHPPPPTPPQKRHLEIILAAFWGKGREPGLCQFECANSEYLDSHAEICMLHIQTRLLKMLIAGDIFYAQVYIWQALCSISIHHGGGGGGASLDCCYGQRVRCHDLPARVAFNPYTRERLNISATAILCLFCGIDEGRLLFRI